jgi:hypothetical protein
MNDEMRYSIFHCSTFPLFRGDEMRKGLRLRGEERIEA